MTISCVILAKNEADLIGESIESLAPLKPVEILVIDDGSTDDTASVARFHKARVLPHKKKDFAEARNFALKHVMGEWILYIDADERVSSELAAEIKRNLDSGIAAYRLTRTNYYLGKKWPATEQMMRLFQKDKLKKWFGELHESPEVIGDVGQLSGLLIHHTHRSLSEMVENTLVWSKIEADLRFRAKHPPVIWWRIPRVMLPVFFDYYIKQGGWKVGTVGLIESIYQAFSIFITYARLWEMQNQQKT